jgi:hypothetical protein
MLRTWIRELSRVAQVSKAPRQRQKLRRAACINRTFRLESRDMLSATSLWAEQIGSTGYDEPSAIAADTLGNVFVAGNTSGSLFEPNGSGSGDAFIAMYNSAGTLQWSDQLTGSSSDTINGIVADNAGNVYAVGWTTGSLGAANAGGVDAFLIKYNSSGSIVWTRQIGSASQDYGDAIAFDGSGNIYIAGGTTGNLGGTAGAGGWDGFVAKYNTSGVHQWTEKVGTHRDEYFRGIAADSLGNVFAAGYAQRNASPFDSDIYVVELNALGTVTWSDQLGSTGQDSGTAVAADGTGGFAITGVVSGAVAGSHTGPTDVYVAKYNSSNSRVWHDQFGAAGGSSGLAIDIDPLGNVYSTGDRGANGFISKHDAAGNRVFIQQIGASTTERSRAISAAGLTDVYVAGVTYGSYAAANAGLSDTFFERFSDPIEFVVNTTSDTTDAFLGNGVAKDSSGNTSLRSAIQEANALDVPVRIILPAGVYGLTITGTETVNDATNNDLDISGNVTIVGAGPGVSVIGASFSAVNSNTRLFELLADGVLSVSGVTLTGGDTSGAGGAIYVGNNSLTANPAYLTVLDSAIVGNRAGANGGAIYNSNGSFAVVRDTAIVGNYSATRSGAIHSNNVLGSVTIEALTLASNTVGVGGFSPNISSYGTVKNQGNNVVDNNVVESGGAVRFTNGVLGDIVASSPSYVVTSVADIVNASDNSYSLSLREAVNLIGSGAGAIWVPAWTHRLTLTGTEGSGTNDIDIAGDVVIVGAGAGLSILEAAFASVGTDTRLFDVTPDNSLEIHGLTLTGGEVSLLGGAISVGHNSFVSNPANLVVRRSTFADNRAGSNGGAIYNSNGSVSDIRSSVFVDNYAENKSGAIHSNNVVGSITVGNLVLARNAVGASGAAPNISGAGIVTNLGGNLVDNNTVESWASPRFVNGVNGDHVAATPSFVVTSVADRIDSSDNNRSFSLREAVLASNQDAVNNKVWIAPWLFVLNRVGTDNTAEYGDLDVLTANDLEIRAAGTATVEDALILEAAFADLGAGAFSTVGVTY